MTNAKNFKLFCFDVVANDEYKDFITNIFLASDLIKKGNILYAFGTVDDNEGTTRTSKIKKIVFDKKNIHIITQNSNYLVTQK